MCDATFKFIRIILFISHIIQLLTSKKTIKHSKARLSLPFRGQLIFSQKTAIQKSTTSLLPSAIHNFLPGHFATTVIACRYIAQLFRHHLLVPSITDLSKNYLKSHLIYSRDLQLFLIQFIHIPFVFRLFQILFQLLEVLIFRRRNHQ